MYLCNFIYCTFMLIFTCFTIFISQNGKQLTLIIYTEHCQVFYQFNFETEHIINGLGIYNQISIK